MSAREEDMSGWFCGAVVFILLACFGVSPADAIDPALEEYVWWPALCVVGAFVCMFLGDRAEHRRRQSRQTFPLSPPSD